LQAILPLAVTSITSRSAAQDFVVLSCAGTYGLLPLLYEVSTWQTVSGIMQEKQPAEQPGSIVQIK
jgi:hypothetical protein